MKKLILSTFTVLAVISLSCKKEKSCTTEEQTMQTSKSTYYDFCTKCGVSPNQTDINIPATYQGSGNWHVTATGETVSSDGQNTLESNWNVLRGEYRSDSTIYSNCISN